MSRKISFLLVLSGLLFSTACTDYYLTVGDTKEVRFKYFKDGTLGLEIDLQIKNEGNMNFKVKEVDLDISLNSIPAGKVVNVEKVIIRRKTEEIYTFPVEVEINGLSNSARILISVIGRQKLVVDINGFIKVKSLMISKKIPVHLKEQVNMH
jgi:LEA14-like dessication related protein